MLLEQLVLLLLQLNEFFKQLIVHASRFNIEEWGNVLDVSITVAECCRELPLAISNSYALPAI